MAFIDGEILTAKALNDAFNAVNRDNIIVIGGVEYQASGTVSGTVAAADWGKVGSQTWLWMATHTLDQPFTPPSGWTFALTVQTLPGEAFQVSPWVIGTKFRTHFWYYLWSTPSAKAYTLGWRLIKAS